MNDFDLEGLVSPSVVDPGRGRRRFKDEKNWDKTKRKIARNSSQAKQGPHITCKHKHNETKSCKVRLLNKEDIDDFYSKLYSNRFKVEQDNFLMKYIMVVDPKRHRPRKKNNPRSRLLTQYFIRKKSGQMLRVCAESFSTLTGVSRFRLNGLSKHLSDVGTDRKEKRGGARIRSKDTDISFSIIEYIKTLKCRESHYGRSKSIRVYMAPELSVKSMWRMWKDSRQKESLPIASFSKFYSIFQRKFNIGFGNPKADMCSFCEECKLKIKCSKSPAEKANLMGQYRLHKLRAKKFYELLKTNTEGVVKVAFDMQQNQPLPMIRVTETFYARQIWLYNLTFIIHEDKQDKNNTFIYSWTEDQSGRGSNEVASALHDFLSHLEDKYQLPDNEDSGPRILQLFSDAASSQNKNSTIVGLLLDYVQKSKIFEKVEHVFPIRGHSFMPPDRVFGRIEKKYRSKEKITSPQQYHNILKEHGTLKLLSKDWKLLNFKKNADKIFKTQMPFSMREQRVFKYEKGKSCIFVKNTYFGDYSKHEIRKKKFFKNWTSLYREVDVLNESNHISEKKKKDVQELLKFVQLSEEDQEYYNKCLQSVVPDWTVQDHSEVVYDDQEPFL
jgi:hypothetical protein